MQTHPLTTTVRSATLALLAFLLVAAVAHPAQASTPTGVAKCTDNMISVTPPAAGQSHTYIAMYSANGEWVKFYEGYIAPRPVSGAVTVDPGTTYWVPRDQVILVRMWGYYQGYGWVEFGVAHGYQFGPAAYQYCRA